MDFFSLPPVPFSPLDIFIHMPEPEWQWQTSVWQCNSEFVVYIVIGKMIKITLFLFISRIWGSLSPFRWERAVHWLSHSQTRALKCAGVDDNDVGDVEDVDEMESGYN